MPNTTRTQIPKEVDAFYNRTLLERAIPLFVHTKWAQIRDIPRNAGTNVVRFRRYGNLSAATTPLTEGVTPVGSQLSQTTITATVAQYGDYITITDVLDYESADSTLMETAELLGDQAADTLDQLTRDIINAGTNVQYANSSGSREAITTTHLITSASGGAEIRMAIRTLKGNNTRKITSMINPSTGYNTTPVNSCFIGIVHPDTTYSLDTETAWTPVEKYSSQVGVMEGEVGKFKEVRFVETTNAKIFAGLGLNGADVYSTLIFGRDAYGVTRISSEALRNIIKPLGSAGTADPLEQRATSGWKATFVAKILNDDFMVRIEHAVAA
jgi:N4-gp56 family major capsid protein